MVAITAAATLVALLATPAVAGRDQGSFKVTKTTIRAGETVKGYGRGCPGRSSVSYELDDRQLGKGKADRHGGFSADLTIPPKTSAGERELGARCGKKFHFKTKVHVFHQRINVHPRSVRPGGSIIVTGRGCLKGEVSVVLAGSNREIGSGEPYGSKGSFVVIAKIPRSAGRGRSNSHTVIVLCGDGHDHKFIGAARIKIKKKEKPPYPPHKPPHVYTDRTSVKPGHEVTITGDDCPDVAPSAKLDDEPIGLTLHETGKDDGFKATARIPRHTLPGKHHLWAGCDTGSTASYDLTVLDADESTAAADEGFGPKATSNLAIWGGLLAGVALLVASLRVGRRRRS